jgi:hypothetical protein
MSSLLLCFLLLQAGPGAPTPDAVVTGRVLDAASGAAVPAATVTIQPSQGDRASARRVLTDDDGRYFFDRLSAGKYSLTVTKPGWIAGAFRRQRPDGTSTPLELAAHEARPRTDLLIWKYAVLSGAIVDEAGQPLVDVEVRAVRRTLVAGRSRMVFAGTTRTDDRGVYRLAGLVPGTYSVFVPSTVMSGSVTFSSGDAPREWLKTMTGEGTAPMSYDFDSGVAVGGTKSVVRTLAGAASAPTTDAPWPSLPPTFAGSPNASGAAVYTVTSGQERRGVDLQIATVPTYSIAGTLSAAGESTANFALHLMPADLSDYPLFDVATAIADATGAFMFFGVPQGDYVIRVVRTPMTADQDAGVATFAGGVVRVSKYGAIRPQLPDEPLLFADQRVSVSDGPLRGVQINLRAGPRISGRAEFAGASNRPTDAEWSRLAVVPERANGLQSFDPPVGFFTSDGTFATRGVMPGEYYLRALTPSGWTLKSVTWQGRDVLDTALELGATDVTDVVVTFIDRPAAIAGSVAAQDTDVSAPAASVLVFPTDRNQWMDYGVTPRRLISIRPLTNGSFGVTALPAGDYFVIAIPDEQAVDWQNPEKLAELAKLAKTIQIRDSEVSNVTLKVERIR